MSLKKPKKWVLLFAYLLPLLLIWLQFLFSITPHRGNVQTSQNLLHNPENFNPFQIEIREVEGSLNQMRNLQVVLTSQRDIPNLYLNIAFIQDMEIIVSDEAPELPQQIPLLSVDSSPLIYNMHIRFTGDQPHLILHAYIIRPNGERVGELAEFYRQAESSSFDVPAGRRLQIDPKKTRVIR